MAVSRYSVSMFMATGFIPDMGILIGVSERKRSPTFIGFSGKRTAACILSNMEVRASLIGRSFRFPVRESILNLLSVPYRPKIFDPEMRFLVVVVALVSVVAVVRSLESTWAGIAPFW